MIFYDSNKDAHTLPENEAVQWRISAYAIVINDEGKILLVTPTWRDTYDIPGGGVEPEEEIAEGLKREVYEETGYKIKVVDNHPFYVSETRFYWQSQPNPFRHSVNLFFRAELESLEQNLAAVNVAVPNEIAKIEWVSIPSITKENCHWMYVPAIEKLA